MTADSRVEPSGRTVGIGRVLAALLGAPMAALAAGSALVSLLPLSEPWAFALGVHAIVPLWAALACTLPLAKSGVRAWSYCALPMLAAGLSWLL